MTHQRRFEMTSPFQQPFMKSDSLCDRIHEAFKSIYPSERALVYQPHDETIYVDLSNGLRYRTDLCSDDDGFCYFARIHNGREVPGFRISIPTE